MVITEEDEKRLEFFHRLNALLNKSVEKEPQEITEMKEYVNSIKWRIRYLLEEMYKEDLFNDDVSVSKLCNVFVDYPLDRYIQQVEKPWLKDKLTVALLGNISVGKTTLLNSFFGENFQTNTEETTALATYLYYGDDSQCKAVGNDGSILRLTDKDTEIFDIDKSDSFPFPRMFSYIAKKNSNPILENITFIDTPGVSSFDEEHFKPTLLALQNSDVAFWLINLKKSVSDGELRFIQNNIGDKPIYFILTFADIRRGLTEEGRANAVNVIKQRISEARIDAKGYLLFGKSEVLQNEFRDNFEDILSDMSDEYHPFYPIPFVANYINHHVDSLIDIIKQITEAKNRAENESNSVRNNFQSKARTFSNSVDSVSNYLNSLTGSFNSNCSGSTFCGNSSSIMASKINALISSWNSMIEAYGAVEYNDLVSYGSLSSHVEEIKGKIERLNNIKNEFTNLLKIFTNE